MAGAEEADASASSQGTLTYTDMFLIRMIGIHQR